MSQSSKNQADGGSSRQRRSFTQEFMDESVQMLLDGHSASSVAELHSRDMKTVLPSRALN